MKATLALICFLAIFGLGFGRQITNHELEQVALQQRVLEDLINSTINAVTAVLSLVDPVQVDHNELSLAGLSAEVTNASLEGFSNVYASHISLAGLITWTLELVLEIPNVTASIENWNADLGILYGNGTVSAKIENAKVAITAKISVLTGTLTSLVITPSIGNAEVSITGLYNDEDVSQRVSDAINTFLNDTINNDKDLQDKISKLVLEVVKKILELITG